MRSHGPGRKCSTRPTTISFPIRRQLPGFSREVGVDQSSFALTLSVRRIIVKANAIKPDPMMSAGGLSLGFVGTCRRGLSGDTLLPWLVRVVCTLDQTTHLKTV